MTMRVVIADESDVMLLGLRAVLNEHPEYSITGQAHALQTLLRMLNESPPDVVIFSDAFVGSDPLDTCEQIAAAAPHAKRILLGMVADGLLLHDLFALGMHAYLYRSDTLSDALPNALIMVQRGRPYLSPTANAEYLVALQRGEPRLTLTPEARNVLRLLLRGCSVGEISAQLQISHRRVYWIRAKLRHRFGALTNEQLAAHAAAEGLTGPTLTG